MFPENPAHTAAVTVDVTPDPKLSSSYTTTTELVVGEKPTIAKAVASGVTALAALLITALADNGITATEWVTVAAGTILAVAGVWVTSNRP